MTNQQVTSSGRPPVSLVTGGAGFVGSHVVDELLKNGHKVVVLDDLSGGFRENVNEGAEFVVGSVTDPHLIESTFQHHKFDYVFHLAAYAAEGLSHFIRCFNYANNVVGSMTVINEAIRQECRCLVFTSSIAVYGAGQTPMTEELTPKPEDPYGIAKYAVELDLHAAQRMFGLNSIIFRPHNIYGERQNIGDRYRNVVGIFMNNILQGLPCTIFGDGTQTRAFTHISDVAPMVANSVNSPNAYGQVFNIGADTPYSVNDLARAIQQAMGKDTGMIHLPARDEVLHAFSDHSKSARYFGQHEKTALDAGLKKMAAWVYRVGAREGKPFQNVEIRRNMPPSWRELCSKGNQ
jgi:UDP-glucose 4-epimerase